MSGFRKIASLLRNSPSALKRLGSLGKNITAKKVYDENILKILAKKMLSDEYIVTDSEMEKAHITQIVMLDDWEQTGKRCYRLGKDFTEELMKTDILNLCDKFIFNDKLMSIFLDFNKSFKYGNKIFFSCFVSVIKENNLDIFRLYFFHEDAGRINCSAFKLCLLGETLEDMKNKISEMSFITFDLIEYVLKSIIYINSGDPDLRYLKPDDLSKKEKKKFFFEHDYSLDVPTTLVSWDWKKPKCYTTDEWSQAGHFRWQPYGKNREKIKLIWIDEMIKKRKQLVKETPEQIKEVLTKVLRHN